MFLGWLSNNSYGFFSSDILQNLVLSEGYRQISLLLTANRNEWVKATKISIQT